MQRSRAFNHLNSNFLLSDVIAINKKRAIAPLINLMLLNEIASACIPFNASRQSTEFPANAIIAMMILMSKIASFSQYEV